MTYKLQIRLANPYDVNPFQLSLRSMETNRDMFLFASTSVAALKTVANTIFGIATSAVSGTTPGWVDDASTEGNFVVGGSGIGTNSYTGVPTTASASYGPVASEVWFYFGSGGTITLYPVEQAGAGV